VKNYIYCYQHVVWETFWMKYKGDYSLRIHYRLPGTRPYTYKTFVINGVPTKVTIHWDMPIVPEDEDLRVKSS
jgi:hypothetical protein